MGGGLAELLMATERTYLVFGDLHGRILPAFRLAAAWAHDHSDLVDGLLQVGDLGYFPDPTRLDKATIRHAQRDPLELGVRLVAEPSAEADAIFDASDAPGPLWFTVGNHEDFEAIQSWERGAGPRANDFAVDAYLKVRCIRNGHVASLPGGLSVGALWGIDTAAPRARRGTPSAGCIHAKNATMLSASRFNVLLTHDSPRDAVMADSGSDEISSIIQHVQPSFAFFGHYGGKGGHVSGDYGHTQVFHMASMELRREGSCAEEGSVGVLKWAGQNGRFEYLDPQWLRTFTKHNWQFR